MWRRQKEIASLGAFDLHRDYGALLEEGASSYIEESISHLPPLPPSLALAVVAPFHKKVCPPPKKNLGLAAPWADLGRPQVSFGGPAGHPLFNLPSEVIQTLGIYGNMISPIRSFIGTILIIIICIS
jgi:hypothetical protein